MFNYDEIKQRKEWFLEEMSDTTFEESTIEFLRNIFSSLEESEKTFEKDVCEFTDEEAIDYLKSINSTSRVSLTNRSWYISKYHEWCYNKGVTQNINDAFDIRTINKIVESIVPNDIMEQKIIKEDYFKECVEKLKNDIDKFILICLYYGARDDEFVSMRNLKITDLDEENKTIQLIGRRLCVDDYFIEHMKKAAEAEFYVQDEGVQSKNAGQTIYIKNDYVIRSTAAKADEYDDNPVKVSYIAKRVSMARLCFGDNSFQIRNISKNGLINFIKKQFQKDNVTLKDAFFKKGSNNVYLYENQIQEHINEFGHFGKTTRSLRADIKELVDKY